MDLSLPMLSYQQCFANRNLFQSYPSIAILLDEKFIIKFSNTPSIQIENSFFNLSPHFINYRLEFDEIEQTKKVKNLSNIQWKEQSLHLADLSIQPLLDENHQYLTGYLLFFTNKNFIAESERKAQKKIELIEKSFQIKNEFLNNVSHEIRSPVTSISGMCQMLRESELKGQQKEWVDIIHHVSENLLSLVNHTLDLSKLESRKIKLESIPFNLKGLIEQIHKVFSVQLNHSKVTMNVDYPPSLGLKWVGDPGRIRQILTNLISNAIKFTEHGEVKISIELKPHKSKGQMVLINVQDSGIGIPEEAQVYIFDKYQQASASTSREYGGTGLGLPICKDLVTLMNGDIGLESQVGKGTRFWVTIPLKEHEEQTPRLKREKIDFKKVLIVDDEPGERMIITKILEPYLLECNTCESGVEAMNILERAQQNNQAYDFILSDYKMPIMDGFEFGKRIKSHPTLYKTNLIMLTSFGRRGDAQKVFNIGYDAYFVKPVSGKVLSDALACIAGNQDRAKTGIITKHLLYEDQISTKIKSPPQPKITTIPNFFGKILIAEDDPQLQMVLKRIFDKLKYDYCIVENGKKALDELLTLQYQLVYLDWNMPKMNGNDVIQRYRQQQPNSDIWIVATTGESGFENNMQEMGIQDVITKPFRMHEFKEKVFQHVEKIKDLIAN